MSVNKTALKNGPQKEITMTGPSSIADCTGTCPPKGSSDPSCRGPGARPSRPARAAKFGAGFVALCAICCAIPPALVGLGLIGITTGAYLSSSATLALIILALTGLGYLSKIYLGKTR